MIDFAEDYGAYTTPAASGRDCDELSSQFLFESHWWKTKTNRIVLHFKKHSMVREPESSVGCNSFLQEKTGMYPRDVAASCVI